MVSPPPRIFASYFMKIYIRSKELPLLVILNREFIHFFKHCSSLLCFWCCPVAAAAPISAVLVVSFPVDGSVLFWLLLVRLLFQGCYYHLPTAAAPAAPTAAVPVPAGAVASFSFEFFFVKIVKFDVLDGSIF